MSTHDLIFLLGYISLIVAYIFGAIGTFFLILGYASRVLGP